LSNIIYQKKYYNENMDDTISQQLAEKTMKELSSSNLFYNPLKSTSRSWTDPEGYKYLVPWSNAVLLRFFVRRFTESLPKSEYRRKSQVDDAARSVVRNIEEGFKRTTTGEYLQFVGYSQGSLEEVKGDIRELAEDKFLSSKPGSSLMGIGINLGDFNKGLRENKGNLKDSKGPLPSFKSPLNSSNPPLPSYNSPLNSFKPPLPSSNAPLISSNPPLNSSNPPLPSSNAPLISSNSPLNSSNPPLRDFTYRPLTVLYPPLSNFKVSDLTYEIFIELINKTDWLLRQLVQSLERKLRDYKLQLGGIRK